MSDLSRSEAEAALEYASPNKPTHWPSETTEDYDERYLAWLRSHDTLVAAARSVLEGTPIWWCQEHRSDYEAAARYFCEVIHPEYENKPCDGHLEWVNDLVGLALAAAEGREE